MSTKMSEDDFVNAVTVFRACLPRSGAKGRDDRLFIEALHYFSVHNILRYVARRPRGTSARPWRSLRDLT